MNDNDNDNDTLIEGGSNMCRTSGPAGMSDGVMTQRKKALEIWTGVERCCSEKSQDEIRNCEVTNSTLLQQTLKLNVKSSFHAGRGQRATCPGARHTTYGSGTYHETM